MVKGGAEKQVPKPSKVVDGEFASLHLISSFAGQWRGKKQGLGQARLGPSRGLLKEMRSTEN